MVLVDLVDVAVLVFVPYALRPGAILAQGMQALGDQPHALIESSEAHMVHTGGGATTTTHGIWSRWRYLGADGPPSPW